MSDIGSGFPKPLAYSYLKRLQGNFSKNTVKIIPDNQTAQPNNVIRFRVSGSGLYDFRSFAVYMTGTAKQDATNNENYKIHFPRYASSLVQDITITANNTTLFSCKEYNYLYNMIHDLEASDASQYCKRNCMGDNYDPSTSYMVSAATGEKDEDDTSKNQILAVRNNLLSSTPSDTSMPLCINNWLFFNSLSVPVLDLSSIGDIYVVITFAPASVLWRSASTVATISTTLTNPTYTLSNIYATIDRIQFSDPLYYQMLTEKLLGEGLSIGYHDYYFSSFSAIKKKSGVSLNWTINSACLDKVLLSFKHRLSTDGSVYPLVLNGANANSTTETNYKTLPELLAAYVSYENDGSGTDIVGGMNSLGDYFNTSIYFMRSGANLLTSKWSVNSVDIDTYALPPIEVFNKYLKHDNFANLDAGSGCINPSCPSLYHFLKYFFVDSLDLTLQVGNDPNMFLSGLNGTGSGLNLQYNATFESSADATITPVAWTRSTKVLSIKAGRQLQIDAPVVY